MHPHSAGGALFGNDLRTHRARLLGKRRPSRKVGIKRRLADGVRPVADRVERLCIAVGGPERVRMRRQDIHQLALVPQVREPARLCRAAVHAGNNRARRVRDAYLARYLMHPCPERGLSVARKAIALVSEIPRRDGRMILHRTDEIPDEPHLPHD